MPRTRLDDAGTRIFRPATGCAIEPTAHISRRPQAARCGCRPRSSVAVARLVQAPSLQAAGPHTTRRLYCRAGRSAVDRAQRDGDRFENTAAATAAEFQALFSRRRKLRDRMAAVAGFLQGYGSKNAPHSPCRPPDSELLLASGRSCHRAAGARCCHVQQRPETT